MIDDQQQNSSVQNLLVERGPITSSKTSLREAPECNTDLYNDPEFHLVYATICR